MDTEYLNRFEERLQQELLRLCTDYHVLDGTLLATEDLDNRWHYTVVLRYPFIPMPATQ